MSLSKMIFFSDGKISADELAAKRGGTLATKSCRHRGKILNKPEGCVLLSLSVIILVFLMRSYSKRELLYPSVTIEAGVLYEKERKKKRARAARGRLKPGILELGFGSLCNFPSQP